MAGYPFYHRRHRLPRKKGAFLPRYRADDFSLNCRSVLQPKNGNQCRAHPRSVQKELAKEKGFVEKKQLENQPLLLVFFELADQNGDGKVDSKEIEAALKAIAPLARCRIDLAL